ncbi:Uncharacterised protein [uncultured Clostridium sp.]|uniref:Uncharacterized protein n=1 Tax=Muricoprocola aceti TaxID=2981772 RepID=A0ABT2SLA4_9FIRM|nr:hypothetical protein [Muricoprocola aceti]MCI7227733.1 hypothetical protein [Lachnospiraceae bacterium]MCU6725282.1 hypothetical protein [Muricoprocola aceti]MDD7436682.1 hypothetical protein [Lachnospiraceae bacterium]SCH45361.1 Uncharacterised protein [uncultured Clostridium sp.]
MEKENREVKSSVFADLFYEDESAEKNIISLYNALHEEPLPEGTQIEKIHVGDAIYMNLKNDISFGVGGKTIIMGEHQSTVNENMPLRNLLYIGRVYEQIVPSEARYRKKRVTLAKPEFYTFYNGIEKEEKERWMRLSDAYKEENGDSGLEVAVKMININPDSQHEILEKCSVLKEYSQFIETIRKYQNTKEKFPYRKAMRECIEKGILKDYLMRRGSEVENMLLAEYDYETDIAVQREEAHEEGYGQGYGQGYERCETVMAELTDKLLGAGRIKDCQRAMKDKEFRKQLMQELGI